MTEQECVDLRDQLFANQFQMERLAENMFRFMAVVPGTGHEIAVLGTTREIAAVVHFTFSPPVWERAGKNCDVSDVIATLEKLVAETTYREKALRYEFHQHLGSGWPLPWAITAKGDFDDFPTLVLREHDDGSVCGVLMRDSHCSNTTVRMSNHFAEPHEVDDLLEDLMELAKNERFEDLLNSWYKDCNIEASSLETAIAMTPQTKTGQKIVLIYRSNEWLSGIWNNPSKPNAYPMHLTSVADFYGIRVSRAKRKTRSGIDLVIKNQTLGGDDVVLKQALALLQPTDGREEHTNYEAIPAIKFLCDWWNANAPETTRFAACFRAYTWYPNRRIFLSSDSEEPARTAEQMAATPDCAVFECKGDPTIVFSFLRGAAYNTVENGSVQTYHAGGEPAYTYYSSELHEINEAYYSLEALRELL